MAQRANNKKGNNKKGGNKKEFKNQPFKMRGTLEKWDTFGDNDNHAWLVIAEETNGTKYTLKMFNINDDILDVLNNSEDIEVYFNIGYNKYDNNINLVLIAHDIFPIEK